MASICCSPLLNVPAFCFCRSFKIGKRWYTFSISSRILSLSFLVNAPISKFSSTVMEVKILRPSGTSDKPFFTSWKGCWPFNFSPPNSISPFLTGTRPQMAFRAVDLPAPLGPIIATISPLFTWKETFSNARTAL